MSAQSQCFKFYKLSNPVSVAAIEAVLLLLITATALFSQTQEVEKLKQELENHPQPDTIRINRLNALGEIYFQTDLKKQRKFLLKR